MTEPVRLRISDALLDAFNSAIEQRDLEIATLVHQCLELVLTWRAGKDNIERRPEPVEMLATWDRLAALRQEVEQSERQQPDRAGGIGDFSR